MKVNTKEYYDMIPSYVKFKSRKNQGQRGLNRDYLGKGINAGKGISESAGKPSILTWVSVQWDVHFVNIHSV